MSNTPPALRAMRQAREAWRAAGCPGTVEQFALFDDHVGYLPEVVKGERADRPRRRRRKK